MPINNMPKNKIPTVFLFLIPVFIIVSLLLVAWNFYIQDSQKARIIQAFIAFFAKNPYNPYLFAFLQYAGYFFYLVMLWAMLYFPITFINKLSVTQAALAIIVPMAIIIGFALAQPSPGTNEANVGAVFMIILTLFFGGIIGISRIFKVSPLKGIILFITLFMILHLI